MSYITSRPPHAFTPFTALMLLAMQPGLSLPLRGDNSSTNATVFIQIDPAPAGQDDNSSFTPIFVEQRDLEEPDGGSDSLEFDTFTVKHISALQSLFESGTHLFDPFVHFIQSLAEGVKGSPPSAPLAVPPSPKDKRMLYMV